MFYVNKFLFKNIKHLVAQVRIYGGLRRLNLPTEISGNVVCTTELLLNVISGLYLLLLLSKIQLSPHPPKNVNTPLLWL